jgi:dTDP-D-glucose 4,6-dehydratase
MLILITGGASLTGSTVLRHLAFHILHEILNLETLACAGHLKGCHHVPGGSYQREQLGANA